MKKTVLAFAAALLLTGAVSAQDKAFKKGDMSLEIGAGFGIYGTHSYDTRNVDQVVISGGVPTVVKVRQSKDTTDGAVSAIYPITFQYGVTNWLGLGARFAFAKYIASSDSTNNNTRPTVTGIDADIFADFHLVKSKHFDMPIRVTMGYSNIHYLANDANDSKAKGGGLNYGIALVPRIFFGDHIGIYFNLGYAGYNYANLIFSDKQDSNHNTDNGQDLKYRLSGNGVNIGLGLVGKF